MEFLQKSKKKIIKKCLKILLFLLVVYLTSLKLFFFYLLCGLLDVCRNRPPDLATIKRYFLGNGLLTWLLSPFNLFLDLISHRNKGIYCLQDLPSAYQQEISMLLQDININKDYLKKEMTEKLSINARGMLFFKWYGDNLDNSIPIAAFHKKYQFIKTLGVSTFNQQSATSTHFGPLRITLRLLYNLSPTNEGEVYIQVGGKKHYWRDDPLFIFDDTLQHQSVNYSNEIRHCMFVDIIRPTYFPSFLSLLLTSFKLVTAKVNKIFYKKWVFLK